MRAVVFVPVAHGGIDDPLEVCVIASVEAHRIGGGGHGIGIHGTGNVSLRDRIIRSRYSGALRVEGDALGCVVGDVAVAVEAFVLFVSWVAVGVCGPGAG